MMEDENKNIDDESIPVKQNGIQVSMLVVIIGVTLSLVYLLTVGLLSGLVFREINACKSNSGALDGLTTTVTPITTTTQPYIPLIALNATLPSYYDVSNYKLKMNIKFNPYLKTVDNTEFGGQVDITMNLGISTSEIIFHAGSQLLILDPIVITNAATGAIVASVLKAQHGSTINDFHYIKLPTNLNAGNYKLSILFGNTIQSLYNNRGLFAREYLDDLIRRYFIIDQK
jgi:hypothetical protein